jgi:hypothetical protein
MPPCLHSYYMPFRIQCQAQSPEEPFLFGICAPPRPNGRRAHRFFSGVPAPPLHQDRPKSNTRTSAPQPDAGRGIDPDGPPIHSGKRPHPLPAKRTQNGTGANRAKPQPARRATGATARQDPNTHHRPPAQSHAQQGAQQKSARKRGNWGNFPLAR